MTDEYPRVENLTYRLRMAEGHELADQAACEGELDGFRYKLAQYTATFVPLRRFATEADARAVLDPQLKAWGLSCALSPTGGGMRFDFIHSYVQTEAPQPGVLQVHSTFMVTASDKVTVQLTHGRHPAPPTDFAINDCVEDLAALLLQAREHPGGLLKDAFSTLTRLEYEFGGLPVAASTLQISHPYFAAVRRLACTRGTGAEVRKFESSVPRTPLTDAERTWLLEALEKVVLRAAAVAAGAANLHQISLATHPAPGATA